MLSKLRGLAAGPDNVLVTRGSQMALDVCARGLARRHRLVVPDDHDHEFHSEGRPVLPLASADEAGHVVYLGTLSKVLAPGLRLGFLVAPRPVVERLTALRAAMDRQGDLTMEAAVAELLEEGDLQRHVRKMRRVYQERRDALVRGLRARLGEVLEVDVPRGGISPWACAVERMAEAWMALGGTTG